ncbi:hypothetical protein B0H11DRAFT_1220804 [Mycena galericulata]|nr:hypothetical protein B0H11DRAFT_1220804 [Mycena galericulata]
MIATIHPVAHILFVLALVASAAALFHANDTSYFCGSHRPSHEHGLTPSHTRLPAVGVLSLIVVLSARALRRAVSTSLDTHSVLPPGHTFSSSSAWMILEVLSPTLGGCISASSGEDFQSSGSTDRLGS